MAFYCNIDDSLLLCLSCSLDSVFHVVVPTVCSEVSLICCSLKVLGQRRQHDKNEDMYINYTFYLNNSVTFCSPPPVPVLPLLTVGTQFLEYVLLINTEKPQGVILFFLNCFIKAHLSHMAAVFNQQANFRDSDPPSL